jgi:hypothetical protein
MSELTDDEIASRDHEISEGDESGTADENWQRAERDLRGAEQAPKEPG